MITLKPQSIAVHRSFGRGFAAFFSREKSTTFALKQLVCRRHLSSFTQRYRCHRSACAPIIMTSPIKYCSLDAVPTFLVREYVDVDVLLPDVTSMVNASLTQGRLPLSQRHAIVTPPLKKAGLDSADMANFRPVSNLSFMSKVVERLWLIS